MPSRNTSAQLDRLRALCEEHGFFQVSGEDINSSRQSFVCVAMRDDKFKNLFDSTWALVGHELASTEDFSKGLFSKESIEHYPDLEERVQVYREIGLSKSGR